ncbi:MAG: NAD(P)-dependent oxidoreductase [Reyranellaceae bacterium]
MHVALIGASGQAGSRILAELSSRGHRITAIARNPEKIAGGPGITAARGDIWQTAAMVELLRGHDAVISSVHFVASDPAALIEMVRKAGVQRYLVVGGAGSLEVTPGQPLNRTPDFPERARAESWKGSEFLALLRQERELDWTFLSPSALFFAGKRTSQFRLGGDQLLTGPDGSSISFEDYAVALVDELEQPRHSRRRFTVGY